MILWIYYSSTPVFFAISKYQFEELFWNSTKFSFLSKSHFFCWRMFPKAGEVSIFSFVKVQKENLSNGTFKTHTRDEHYQMSFSCSTLNLFDIAILVENLQQAAQSWVNELKTFANNVIGSKTLKRRNSSNLIVVEIFAAGGWIYKYNREMLIFF